MKILIEDYKYIYAPEKSDIKEEDAREIQEFLKCIGSRSKDGAVPYVGYLYSRTLEDCVFFLPKVIVDEQGKVLGKYEPIDLWKNKVNSFTKEERDFLFSFPIWTYLAVNTYNRRNPENIIVRKQTISKMDSSKKDVNTTFLDCILDIIRFAQEHKNVLLFKMQNLHHSMERVNWPKTISTQQPLLKKGKAPIYLQPIVKKKAIDYEEELLVIYFSILRILKEHYGFQVDINLNFELIAEKKLDSKSGIKRLREIRYKYFSDITLKIWQLCYAYFERKEKMKSSNIVEDYLIASSFHTVFEAMVDELLGNDLPAYMKKDQDDDKRIDHLFLYNSLIDPALKTYYIADSKYYEIGHRPKGPALFKQYTYARNVIQVRNKNKEDQREKQYDMFRDDRTEGYNIVPNFFLSAFINKKLSYDTHDIVKSEDGDVSEFHFENRLFDRETLLLSQFDINYLFVIKQYATNASNESFRKEVHALFRNHLLERLNNEYCFKILTLKQRPKAGFEKQALENVLTPFFKLINGKVLCPKRDEQYTNLILALKKTNETRGQKENEAVLSAVKADFIIEDFKLGKRLPAIRLSYDKEV